MYRLNIVKINGIELNLLIKCQNITYLLNCET
jgi:hypothetical protein